MRPLRPSLILLLILILLNATARASFPHNAYKLAWDVPGEELVYQSCGCADSCWLAEVRSKRKAKAVRAILRCDCEKLYFSRTGEAEHVVAESCDDINTDGKMNLISQRMKALMQSPAHPK